jgi:hypothetical protein
VRPPPPAAPRHDPPGSGRDPLDEVPEAEREARLRRLSRLLQAGGAVFLGVVALGLLPAVLAQAWPALGRPASIAVWVVAPLVTLALLVFAAFRLRR